MQKKRELLSPYARILGAKRYHANECALNWGVFLLRTNLKPCLAS